MRVTTKGQVFYRESFQEQADKKIYQAAGYRNSQNVNRRNYETDKRIA